MTCARTEALDLASFIVDAGTAEWDEFRQHYPSCQDCSQELALLGSLEESLSGGSISATGHPEVSLLEQLSSNRRALPEAQRRDLEEHVSTCRSCADELAVYRSFDFSVLEEAPGKARAGLLSSAGQALRGLFASGEADSQEARGWKAEPILSQLEPALVFQDEESANASMNAPAEEAPGPVAVLAGGSAGQPAELHPVPAGESHVGRSPEAEICIDSPHLSRLELRIVESDGSFEVSTLNRQSDLRVNANVVQQHALQDGDLLEFRGVRLRFRTLSL